MKYVGVLLGTALSAVSVSAAVYEVGSGKMYATIQAGVDAASGAGDTVLVHAGRYPESVTVNKTGTADAPFVLKAVNHDDVIVDGADVLTGWVRCSSADDIGGNPDWASIYYAAAPSGSDRTGINLRQNDSLLTLCQVPAASDPFYDETTSEWWEGSAYTSSSVTDPVHLTEAEDGYWVGAYAKIQAGNNVVYTSRITGYDASSGRISFSAIGASSNFGTYCISNHPMLIQKPGDYYFDEDNDRIYAWPHDAATINATTYYSARDRGLYVPGGSHTVVDGLNFLRYTGQHARLYQVSDIIIRNCSFIKGIEGPGIYGYGLTRCVVESTYIGYSKDARGIIFGSGGSYNTVRYCTFRKTGGTAIDYYGESNSDLLYNDLRYCNGQHANGLTCYLGGSNTLIKGNVVVDCNVGLTYQEQDGMTIVNNVFDGGGTAWPVACWNPSNTSDVTFVHNTSINSGSNRSGFYRLDGGTITNLVVKNNILHGMENQTTSADIGYNIYTMYAPTGQIFGDEGSQVLFNGEASLMVDHTDYDYRLATGSAAIDAGTDMGVAEDIDGTARPYGSAPDIGAYEWAGTGFGRRPDEGTGIPGILAITPNPCPRGHGGRIVFSAPVEGAVRLADMAGNTVAVPAFAYDRGSCFIPTDLVPGSYAVVAGGKQVGTLMIVE